MLVEVVSIFVGRGGVEPVEFDVFARDAGSRLRERGCGTDTDVATVRKQLAGARAFVAAGASVSAPTTTVGLWAYIDVFG
jgi:hypothetical protein